MKYIFLVFTFICLSISLVAQTDEPTNVKYKLGLTTGYTYAKRNFIQAGAIWETSYGNPHNPSKGFGVGADLGVVDRNLVVAPKIFYENNLYLITGFRMNAITYFNWTDIDFRLMPQIGISFFGNLNFMYGYSLPIFGHEINSISRHSFSVTVNLLKG